MIYTETKLKGAFIVDIAPNIDKRGFFARSWCVQESVDAGLNTSLVQCNISFNDKKGTLRGMHFQKSPFGEIKLVRCTRGGIYDVIIDIRPESDTFRQWVAVELTQDNYRSLYIPEGFAHGFCTLEDNTEVFYQMSSEYVSKAAAGIRWNDPSIDIEWPEMEYILSQRDMQFPDFNL